MDVAFTGPGLGSRSVTSLVITARSYRIRIPIGSRSSPPPCYFHTSLRKRVGILIGDEGCRKEAVRIALHMFKLDCGSSRSCEPEVRYRSTMIKTADDRSIIVSRLRLFNFHNTSLLHNVTPSSPIQRSTPLASLYSRHSLALNLLLTSCILSLVVDTF